MGRHKQINGKFVPVGLAVRHDILKMIYQAPTTSIRLPSALRLAKKHHVSRSTVTTELKKLSDMGWIIGKPGIGSFSNPKNPIFTKSSFGKKIIGLLCGDTWRMMGDYTDWSIFSYAGLEMIPDIGHPKQIILTSLESESVYQELCTSIVDGMIWLSPPESCHKAIRRLHEEGKPVITLYDQVPGVPNIEFDHPKIGEKIAELLLKKNIGKIVWCTLEDPNPKQVLHGAESFWKKHAEKYPEITVIEKRYLCIETLEERFKKNDLPDAVFVHSDFLFAIRELMEKYSLIDRILLITSYGHVRKEKNFKGIVYRHDFREMGALAARYMQKMLNGEKDQVPMLTALPSEVMVLPDENSENEI